MMTLRKQLFRSHLLVMVVAVVVSVVVFALVASLTSGLHYNGRGPDGPDGPGFLLAPIAAAALSASFVSWRVSRVIAEPLEEAGSVTRQIANGDYAARVNPTGIAELDQLSGDVHQLAEALEATEKQRLELIGDVAHELRNPLATIQATMEGLMDGVTTPDETTFVRVSHEVSRLRRLARDLSNLSASNEPEGKPDHGQISLWALAAEVAEVLRPQAEAKSLVLRYENGSPPDPIMVTGSADRLTQVLMNVIGNAIQYTDNGEIVVSPAREDGAVGLCVRDTGRGLADSDLSKVFERFYRVDRSYADGTGVGLAIARSIVRSHGGTISAASEGLGAGTTMLIMFPEK